MSATQHVDKNELWNSGDDKIFEYLINEIILDMQFKHLRLLNIKLGEVPFKCLFIKCVLYVIN